jgi:erythromycin esterase
MIPGRPLALLPSFLFGGWMMILILCSMTLTGQEPDTLFRKDEVTKIRSIDVADTDFSDLVALKLAIGQSRIVLLGEQTHGEGSTFLAKTRLIKMLHEQMGFEVLAFESGMYDCTRIWENMQQGGQLSKEAIGSLFYMYATSRQMLPLFSYMQREMKGSRPLVLAGFESQHTGRKAITDLFRELESFLKAGYPEAGHFETADSNWSVFRRLSLAMFASRDFRPAEKEKKTFFNELSLLKNILGEERGPVGRMTASSGFWYQVACSIESQALRYWQLTASNEMAVRDRQMAENLIWLAEKAYPEKKIIVWAHNVHIARNVPWSERPMQPVTGETHVFIPMGVTIQDHFGASAYCIGFSGSNGSYMNYINDAITTVNPAPSNSLEGRLAAAGYQYAFVNYRRRTGWMEQKHPGGFADYQWLNGIWPEVFDGLFYIRTVFPVDRTANRTGN